MHFLAKHTFLNIFGHFFWAENCNGGSVKLDRWLNSDLHISLEGANRSVPIGMCKCWIPWANAAALLWEGSFRTCLGTSLHQGWEAVHFWKGLKDSGFSNKFSLHTKELNLVQCEFQNWWIFNSDESTQKRQLKVVCPYCTKGCACIANSHLKQGTVWQEFPNSKIKTILRIKPFMVMWFALFTRKDLKAKYSPFKNTLRTYSKNLYLQTDISLPSKLSEGCYFERKRLHHRQWWALQNFPLLRTEPHATARRWVRPLQVGERDSLLQFGYLSIS